MNTLLVFFALPVATIILAIVLERVWGCYKLATATIFAIYLIGVFALFDASYLVYALIYTFLAFIVSYLSMFIKKLNERINNLENANNQNNTTDESENDCNCSNLSNNSENTLISARATSNNNSRNGNYRNCYRRRF